MPEEDLPGGSFDGCIVELTDDGHDEEAAERICGTLLDESKSENGDVDQLRESIEQGRGLIADVNVDLNSAVDVPAIDSQWVAMKSNDSEYDIRTDAEIVLKADGDDEKRISYAPAMIPRELDKEGDVVGTTAVENAAHEYLASEGGVDTDHNLIDGKGKPVESWIEPEARTWELPNGKSKEYPAGTWMLGIKWDKEPWQRIKAGELTGLSIYGQAEKVELGKSASKDEDFEDPCEDGYTMVGLKPNGNPRCVPDDEVPDAKDFVVPYADETVVHVVYESRTAAAKAAETMGFEGDPEEITHPHEFDGMDAFMPAPDHEAYVEAYMELAEDDGDSEPQESAATDTNAGDSGKADGETDNTTEQKATKQNQSMTDDTTGGDDSPDVEALKSEIDSLSETVGTLKEAVEAEKAPGGSASGALDEAVQALSEHEDIELANADIRDQLKELITAGKADDGDMDDEDDEDEEKAASEEAETEKSEDVNLGKSAGGAATAQSATQTAKNGEANGRSASDVLDRSNAVDRHNEANE